MATKYVVIPEDMYKSLLHDEKKSQIGLPSAEAAVEKVKRSKQRNKSAKNVIYNQKLRRYLKTRKEELDKPVIVELVQGAVKKPSIIQTGQQPTPKQQSGSRKRHRATLSESSDDNGFEYDEEDFIPGGSIINPRTAKKYQNISSFKATT